MMSSPNGYGHDRRRHLSPDEQRYLYERAEGICQRCGQPLDARWHSAHLISYTHGGATSVEQMEAWCWRCNLKLGPQDAEHAPSFTPRIWQQQAFRPLLEDLFHHGVATLHAAPGAGKTFEIGWIFQHLYDAGAVKRLLVVVPGIPLIGQWVEELGMLGIHLDSSPRDGVIELEGTVGAVVCYQSLPRSARAHAVRMDRIPTLVAWDEVHHLAEKRAWGSAARTMVGDVDKGGTAHAAAVLNATGTLFRSSPRQRIATVAYQEVATNEGMKIQAKASYSITTADLIGTELRSPELYVYTGHAQLMDLREEEVVAGEIADLDKQQRQAVMRESFTSRSWLRGYCEEALVLLERQLLAIERAEPLKLLYIAQNRHAARKAADMLNEITKDDFARLIIGDEAGSIQRLKAAKRERRSCAIVAVQMVTEGFDCNHIAVTAYAAHKTAPLFIAQAMARNMRVTATERAAGRMLPATTLIPDSPEIRKAFASALANAVHEVVDEDEVCRQCGLAQDLCQCPRRPPPPPPLPRYKLLDLDDPRLRRAVVLGHDDGEVDGKELNEQWLPVCKDLGIWEIFAPKVAVAARRVRQPVRIYADPEPEAEAAEAPASTGGTRTPANPRDVNVAHRNQLQQGAGWMSKHIGHDDRWEHVGAFVSAANKDAGIPYDYGKRKWMKDLATAEQLRACAAWMRDRISEHCETHGCGTPTWLAGETI